MRNTLRILLLGLLLMVNSTVGAVSYEPQGPEQEDKSVYIKNPLPAIYALINAVGNTLFGTKDDYYHPQKNFYPVYEGNTRHIGSSNSNSQPIKFDMPDYKFQSMGAKDMGGRFVQGHVQVKQISYDVAPRVSHVSAPIMKIHSSSSAQVQSFGGGYMASNSSSHSVSHRQDPTLSNNSVSISMPALRIHNQTATALEQAYAGSTEADGRRMAPGTPGAGGTQQPVGDAVLPLLMMAILFCGVIALRRRRLQKI